MADPLWSSRVDGRRVDVLGLASLVRAYLRSELGEGGMHALGDPDQLRSRIGDPASRDQPVRADRATSSATLD